MIVLGIDTSTALCGAAVGRDGRVVASEVADRPQAHAEQLLGVVDACLRAAGPGTRPAVVAVSSGPGSFTGLRIGFSTAKGLCLAHGSVLVAVPTFDAWARAAAGAGPPGDRDAAGGAFLAAMAAGREDAYVAAFRGGPSGVPEVLSAPVVRPLRDLAGFAAGFPGAPVLTDRPDLAAAWFEGGGARRIVDATAANPAETVALLGSELYEAGVVADLRTAEPAYLKDFSTTKPH